MISKYVEYMEAETLRNLSAETVEILDSAVRTYSLDRGEMLFNVGDMADSIYIVLTGGIKIVEDTFSGKRIILELNTAGDMFGLASLISASPYPHSAYAVEKSLIASIYRGDANEMIETRGDFAQMVVGQLVGRVQRAHARLKHTTMETVDRRLARTLIYYSGKLGRKNGNTVAISIALSQQDLADFTGSTLESVNRILQIWEREGWIRCARQRVDILNPAALEAHVVH